MNATPALPSPTWQETIDRIPRLPVSTVLGHETVVRGRFLHFRARNVILPDGTPHRWEVMSRDSDVVTMLAMTSGRILLLIAGRRDTIGSWHITMPAGLVDPGQDHVAACHAELRQETGYVGERVQFLIETPPSPGITDEKVYQYFMPDVTLHPDGQELEPTENIRVLPVPLDELDNLVRAVRAQPDMFTLDPKIYHALQIARLDGLL